MKNYSSSDSYRTGWEIFKSLLWIQLFLLKLLVVISHFVLLYPG